MTPEEHANLLRDVRFEALWALVRGLHIIAATAQPSGGQWFRARFAEMRHSNELVTIPGAKPEYSDMISAMYRDAMNELLDELERKLPK